MVREAATVPSPKADPGRPRRRRWLGVVARTLVSGSGIAAALVACLLGWLWVSARMGHPQRWYHSDDRSCFYLGCDLDDALEDGGGTLFRVHFDCGPDVHVFQPHDFDRFGVLYRANTQGSGWQFLDVGIRLWAAAPALAAVLGIAVLRRPFVTLLRLRRGACARCGHPLLGAARCAECGTTAER